MSTSQKLYDEPARDEAELTRRWGLYRLDLRWPAAPGATRYRVRRDGEDVATVPASPDPTWGADVKGKATYSVEAGDAAGAWSAPLTAEVSHEDFPAAGGGLIGVLGGPRGEAIADVFQAGSEADGVIDGGTADAPVGLDTLRAKSPKVRLGAPTVSGALAADTVVKVLKRHLAALRYCGERGKVAAGARGTLRFMATAEGRVSGAEATLTPENEGARECLERLAARLRLPAAEKTTNAEVPFSFERP